MRLHLDPVTGKIPVTYPERFWRVESWIRGAHIADFDDFKEAQAFAVADAEARGYVYDHRVSAMEVGFRLRRPTPAR